MLQEVNQLCGEVLDIRQYVISQQVGDRLFVFRSRAPTQVDVRSVRVAVVYVVAWTKELELNVDRAWQTGTPTLTVSIEGLFKIDLLVSILLQNIQGLAPGLFLALLETELERRS